MSITHRPSLWRGSSNFTALLFRSIISITLPACAVDLAGFAVFESPVVSSQYRVRFRFQYMTSCSTYNRSQSLFDDSGINATISDSEIVALISQTVQAAMAAERAKVLSSTLSPGSSSIASATIGGVPAVSPCSLTPATIIAQPCAGRAVSSSSIIVPWFVSTFAAAAMSALSLASCAASFLAGPSRNSGHAAVASVLRRSWPARTLICAVCCLESAALRALVPASPRRSFDVDVIARKSPARIGIYF